MHCSHHLIVLLISLMLASALGVLVGFALEGIANRVLPTSFMAVFRWPQRTNEMAVRWMASRLFGLGNRKEGLTNDENDEWSGRMNYIKSVVKEAVKDSQQEIAAEISALKSVSRTINVQSLFPLC